ncbi:hypothetical protein [Streptomyces sp. NRRL S-495]|uniref:RNA polymerase sigma factor n=1 Tax=Streptomyces sp. NRRL S-495 TaxID=1609133 RepID=UPI0006979A1F|nr:hypothetical protein [Streptomyces sp. NRRL S-495]
MVQVERSGAWPQPTPPRRAPGAAERLAAAPSAATDESAVRRKADQALVDRLAARGWTGPEYVVLEAGLLERGRRTLHRWITTGEIYRRCFDKGRPLQGDQAERTALRERLDERESVVGEAVTLAWHRFREHALVGGDWNCDGGATLASYFVGAVLLAFPDAHRRWLREHRREPEPLPADGLPETAHGTGPAADEVFGDAEHGLAAAEELIAGLQPGIGPERCRVIAQIVYGRACGMSDGEIGRVLGISADAVAMRMLRFRGTLDAGQ